MNNMDKLKQLVLGVNATFHNVMMTPRIPHAESPAPKNSRLLVTLGQVDRSRHCPAWLEGLK